MRLCPFPTTDAIRLHRATACFSWSLTLYVSFPVFFVNPWSSPLKRACKLETAIESGCQQSYSPKYIYKHPCCPFKQVMYSLQVHTWFLHFVSEISRYPLISFYGDLILLLCPAPARPVLTLLCHWKFVLFLVF